MVRSSSNDMEGQSFVLVNLSPSQLVASRNTTDDCSNLQTSYHCPLIQDHLRRTGSRRRSEEARDDRQIQDQNSRRRQLSRIDRSTTSRRSRRQIPRETSQGGGEDRHGCESDAFGQRFSVRSLSLAGEVELTIGWSVII